MNKSLTNLFSIQTDFAQGGALRFLATVLIALAFSLAMSYLYRAYYRDNEPVDSSISRSLPLIGPAVTTIFWMIQFSLPLSLGLLGALSFVRFRTPVKRAEDIAFILILIAGSLACAVAQYTSMLILLVIIFAYGSLRDYIPGIRNTKERFAILTIHSAKDIDTKKLTKSLSGLSAKIFPVSTSKLDNITTYVFNINKFDKENTQQLINKVAEYDQDAKVNIFFPENQYGVS